MKEKILPRRTVLRAGLAISCSMLLPVTLLAGETKKVAVKPDSTLAVGKVSPTSVKYQQQPKGEQKCASCMNFITESNTCKIVDGTVSPDGWCSLWAKMA